MFSQGLGFNTSTLTSLNVTLTPIGKRVTCGMFLNLWFQFSENQDGKSGWLIHIVLLLYYIYRIIIHLEILVKMTTFMGKTDVFQIFPILN